MKLKLEVLEIFNKIKDIEGRVEEMKRELLICLLLFCIVSIYSSCGPEEEKIEILPLTDKTIPALTTFTMDIYIRNPSGAIVVWEVRSPTLTQKNYELIATSYGAVFRWFPLVSQLGVHTFTFIARTSNSEALASVTLTVVEPEGAPVFLKPGDGGTYDISKNPCIEVDIEVKDDDSLEVEIREREPKIEGGTLEKIGTKKALWKWCPTPKQLSFASRYTLYLEADDHQHEPVLKIYNIILRQSSKPNCPGEPPFIESLTPPPPQQLSTIQDIEIRLTVSDDNGIKEAPILYYTYEGPPDMENLNLSLMEQTSFSRIEGKLWHAFIPNRVPIGKSGDIYYIVSVKDDDDPTGTGCDHITDSELKHITVNVPSDPELNEWCGRCSRNEQCRDGLCVVSQYGSFCGKYCNNGGCSEGVCRQVTTVSGTVTSLCVPESMKCEQVEECADDNYEPNNTLTTATRVFIDDEISGLVICGEDIDIFRVDLRERLPMELSIYGWNRNNADLDLALLNNLGEAVYVSTGYDETETIYFCFNQVSNPYYILVLGYNTLSASYNLRIRSNPGGNCCDNDNYEVNDDYTRSVYISNNETIFGKICPGDEDWFSFLIDSSKRVTINLLFTHSSGDLDMELYKEDLQNNTLRIIGWSYGVEDDEQIIAELREPLIYYIRVYGYSGATNEYLLGITMEDISSTSRCRDSTECGVGQMCNPTSGQCIDDSCTPGITGDCFVQDFCPEVPSFATESSCVSPCATSSDCRDGYICKIFDEGRGCARLIDNRATGASCRSFEECLGERTCLDTRGGYCAEINCTQNSDCPYDAQCVTVYYKDRYKNICLKNCRFEQCRTGEGYRCYCAYDVSGSEVWVCGKDNELEVVNQCY